MNDHDKSHDPELSGLMQAWQVEKPEDPALGRKVWARLESDRKPVAAGWWASLGRLLAQPAAALAAIALFAAAGALTAELQGAADHRERTDRLATEYARSIDPILMTHPQGNGHSP